MFYNLPNIRNLLIQGFSETELRQFCFYDIEFRDVYNQISQNASTLQIAHQIVEHAQKRDLIAHLLESVQIQNPAAYEKCGPYFYEVTGPAPHPIPRKKKPSSWVVGSVLTLVIGSIIILVIAFLIVGAVFIYYSKLTPTPRPTNTRSTVLLISTPTALPSKPPLLPSPTIIPSTPTVPPTPTPYYVEIVIDTSERMKGEFEGGFTKMESAWQTAGTIARTRAQLGQFISFRLFGGQNNSGANSCLTSQSLLGFTDDAQKIINHLATAPMPGEEAAVVTALLDASAELQSQPNVGREIILITGGDDGCGSTLSAFYSSKNQSLWSQTFVVLFAEEEFGPFINLKTQGANINYDLVRNQAEAQMVAKKVADSPPPTPTPAASNTSPPASTPSIKNPFSSPTAIIAPAQESLLAETQAPIVTSLPANISTPTATQIPVLPTATSLPTSTSTPPPPTSTPLPTPTPTPTPTFTSTPPPTPTPTPTQTPVPKVDFTNLADGQEVETDGTCGFILQGTAQGGTKVRITIFTDNSYPQGTASVNGENAWDLQIFLGGMGPYQFDHRVMAELLGAGDQVMDTYEVTQVKRIVECQP